MSQLPKNKVIYSDEDFHASLQQQDGYVFLHLTVHNFSKTVLNKIKRQFVSCLYELAQYKLDLVFVMSDDEKSVKFWKMLAPLEELDTFGSRNQYWIGAWHIGDTLNGY